MIDLHIHSKCSLEGKKDINDILNLCSESGVKYISITDHNTVRAYYNLDQAKNNFKGTILYGIEADAIVNNKTFDFLCYGFNLDIINK